MGSTTRLLPTGAGLEGGRMHEMQTRAPFLKTSAVPVVQNASLNSPRATLVNLPVLFFKSQSQLESDDLGCSTLSSFER